MSDNILQGKKALIVGGAGFVGGYLASHLAGAYGCEVFATHLPGEPTEGIEAQFTQLDILDLGAIEALLAHVQPNFIFHLAAQSSVAHSWQNPDITLDVNIKGSTHLLQAVQKSGQAPRILLIGSGDEYGAVRPQDIPVQEDILPRPGNIYAVSKVCQNMLGSVYAKAYGLQTIMVRAFNHIGPRQTPAFVVADFCKQVAEIEAGKREPVLRVGNLTATRNFTDVRDVVAAYALLAQKGQVGETYNVGSGHSVVVRSILQQILELATCPITVEVDPQKLRPIDVPVVEVDIRKIQAATGWQPKIPLQQTLQQTLEYWRGLV
ncbi:GDP-mannose 4,6-dehydratase [Ruminococcaceae bacterium OttesenSCG-928-A16]|nr:GDP-mannose 4,6-dehydratase [Ruminococcaceae bacterium OttesenSCG-928-A16]